MEYSEKVMEHFMCPQNCGRISNPDVSFAYGDPSCGDAVIFFMVAVLQLLQQVWDRFWQRERVWRKR